MFEETKSPQVEPAVDPIEELLACGERSSLLQVQEVIPFLIILLFPL